MLRRDLLKLALMSSIPVPLGGTLTASAQETPRSGGTLVVAVPGSPKGAADCLRAIASLLPHAVALIRGERLPHPTSAS